MSSFLEVFDSDALIIKKQFFNSMPGTTQVKAI